MNATSTEVNELFCRVCDNSVFVLVVNLDFKKFLDTFGRPHLNRIPSHSLSDVHAEQKLTQASHPVQLSGMTTAISFGFFFFRVIFPGASGIISVGFAFLGSYATD
jgi:hypothetical protein